jgi:hypothetical protein
MITFSSNPTRQTPLLNAQPFSSNNTTARPKEKPIADIEDFQSVDRVCLSCPSKGEKALPFKDANGKHPKAHVRKPAK